jgi:hypothetical protein
MQSRTKPRDHIKPATPSADAPEPPARSGRPVKSEEIEQAVMMLYRLRSCLWLIHRGINLSFPLPPSYNEQHTAAFAHQLDAAMEFIVDEMEVHLNHLHEELNELRIV